MTECPICGRDSSSKRYCEYHETAYLNLQSGFEEWHLRSTITWEDYLDRISHLEGTGQWIIEIIEHIRSKDDS